MDLKARRTLCDSASASINRTVPLLPSPAEETTPASIIKPAPSSMSQSRLASVHWRLFSWLRRRNTKGKATQPRVRAHGDVLPRQAEEHEEKGKYVRHHQLAQEIR